jgi:hypothetical protein
LAAAAALTASLPAALRNTALAVANVGTIGIEDLLQQEDQLPPAPPMSWQTLQKVRCPRGICLRTLWVGGEGERGSGGSAVRGRETFVAGR